VIYDLCRSTEKELFDAVPDIALRTKALIEKETVA